MFYYLAMTNQNEVTEHNLVELVEFEGIMEAQILKTKLDSEGIPCMLKYDSIGMLLGITTNGLGKVKVMVPDDFLEKARELQLEDDHAEDDEQLPVSST